MFTKSMLFFCICTELFSQSLSNCVNGRYQNNIFPSPTYVQYFSPIVTYGSNTNYLGITEILDMYLFQPTGDTTTKRPLVILAFGGSFVTGSKESGDIITYCKDLTQKGYVTASIKYRIGQNQVSGDPFETPKAVIRGVHDMKAAIRYFYKDARTANNYRIDTNNIFIGGVSSGSVLSLQAAYMDYNELAPAYQTVLATMGGVSGTSGNAGYPERVKGVINMCGFIADTNWIDHGDPALFSVHGSVDATAPFGTQQLSQVSFPMVVSGSQSMAIRANNVGLTNTFKPFWGEDHVPMSYKLPYIDTTKQLLKEFLYNLVCTSNTSSIQESEDASSIAVFPNPNNGSFTIQTDLDIQTIQIVDIMGKVVYQQPNGSVNINANFLSSGLYFLRIKTQKSILIKRIEIQ